MSFIIQKFKFKRLIDDSHNDRKKHQIFFDKALNENESFEWLIIIVLIKSNETISFCSVFLEWVIK